MRVHRLCALVGQSSKPHTVLQSARRRRWNSTSFANWPCAFERLLNTELKESYGQKRLSAELAAWIVNREIQAMVGKDTPP